MRIAGLAAGTGLALLVLTLPCRADEKSELVDKMFELSGYQQEAEDYMNEYAKAMTESWKAGLNDPDDAALAALEGELARRLVQDYISLKPVLAKMYRDEFTEAELRAAVSFYQSPMGRSIAAKSHKINSHIAKVVYPETLKQAEKHWYEAVDLLRKQGKKL